MVHPKVLILTALQIEGAHVAASLGLRRPRRGRPSFGTFLGLEISIHLIGMGARDLAAISAERPAYVVLAGFAGGLSRELRVGDVVVDARPGNCQIPQGCVRGNIHCADQVIVSPREKEMLFVSTNALAVDMESRRVGEWAAHTGLESVVIRTISDSADQSLSRDLLNLVDSYGAVRPARLMTTLARRPLLARDVWRLALSSRKAGKNLGRAVHQFIELNRNRLRGKESLP